MVTDSSLDPALFLGVEAAVLPGEPQAIAALWAGSDNCRSAPLAAALAKPCWISLGSRGGQGERGRKIL